MHLFVAHHRADVAVGVLELVEAERLAVLEQLPVVGAERVVDAIQAVATDGRDRPLEDVVIETIEIAQA